MADHRCACEPSPAQLQHAESRWRLERQRRLNRSYTMSPLEQRTFTSIVDVEVAVLIDLSADRLLPQTPSQYAQQLVDTCNEVLQLRTTEFTAWAGRSTGAMESIYGLPPTVAAAVYAYLHPPIVAAPNVRFVLSQVVLRPANTDGKVDPFSDLSRRQLKLGRLPAVPGLINVWVTELTDEVLGFGALPFDPVPTQFGVVLDYRSTDPRFGGNPNYADNRTLSHELGHLCGLFHTFTDPTSAVPVGAQLDDPLGTGSTPQDLVGDGAAMTPPQQHATRGDPLNNFAQDGAVFNDAGQVVCFVSCMDYAADPAVLMLTADQVARFEYFLNTEVIGGGLLSAYRSTGVTDWDLLPQPSVTVQVIELDGDGDDVGQVPLSAAAIAGIVVGVLAVIALVLGLTLAFHPNHRKTTPGHERSYQSAPLGAAR